VACHDLDTSSGAGGDELAATGTALGADAFGLIGGLDHSQVALSAETVARAL
jgi:hypothetical protein